MLRASFAAALLLLTCALAGCSDDDKGQLKVQVTDLPGNIADFSRLDVTVTQIVVTGKDGPTSYAPRQSTFDLRQLVNGNLTTLFEGDVAVGNYTKLELTIQDAQGQLVAGGTASVKAPGGKIFLTQAFEVKADKETTFVFDIVVHKQGNGSYIFQPNATGSRVK